MTGPPSLSAQIEAVGWARRHLHELGRRLRLREGEIIEMGRRLDAAIETLARLDQARR